MIFSKPHDPSEVVSVADSRGDEDEDSEGQIKLNLTEFNMRKYCKDRIFLLLIVIMHAVLGFGLFYNCQMLAEPRLLRNTDSWGNRCGVPNDAPGVPNNLTGRDMSAHGSLLLMSHSDVRSVVEFREDDQRYLRLCVKECPRRLGSCKAVMRDNGYSIDRDLMMRRACVGPQAIVMPHKKGRSTCLPWLLPLESSVNTTSVYLPPTSRFSATLMREMEGAMAHRRLVLVFAAVAVFFAYALTLIIYIFAHIGPYYFAFFAVHSCVLCAGLCCYRVLARVRMDSLPADDNADLVRVPGAFRLHDSKNSTFNASLSDVAVVFYKDLKAHFLIEDPGLMFELAFIGTTVGIALATIVLGAFRIHRRYLDATTAIFGACSEILSRTPAIFLLPLFTVWIVPALLAFGCFLVYGMVVPRDARRDADGVMIVGHVTDQRTLLVNTVCLVTLACVIKFVTRVQKFLIAGCVAEAFFCPKTPYGRIKRSLGLPVFRLARSLVTSIGQLAVDACMSVLRGPLTRLHRCVTCCDGNRCCDHAWHHLESHTSCAYVAIAIFGDGHATATRRTRAMFDTHARYSHVANRMMDFYLVLAHISATLLPTIIVLFLHDQAPDHHLPLVAVILVSCAVSASVLDLYRVAKDAVLVCYCMDMDTNNGRDRPYRSPCQLAAVMERLKRLDQLRREEKQKKRSGTGAHHQTGCRRFASRLLGVFKRRGRDSLPESQSSHFTYEEPCGIELRP